MDADCGIETVPLPVVVAGAGAVAHKLHIRLTFPRTDDVAPPRPAQGPVRSDWPGEVRRATASEEAADWICL